MCGFFFRIWMYFCCKIYWYTVMFSYKDTITFLFLLFFCSGMLLGMKHYREICLHVVLKYALCPQGRYELCNLNWISPQVKLIANISGIFLVRFSGKVVLLLLGPLKYDSRVHLNDRPTNNPKSTSFVWLTLFHQSDHFLLNLLMFWEYSGTLCLHSHDLSRRTQWIQQ